MLEYACQGFHRTLPSYLSDEIERIQQRAMRIFFPEYKYSEALKRAGIPTLSVRRQSLCLDLFSNIVKDGKHKLADLLPLKSNYNRELRSRRVFNIPVCKTDRYKNSFIINHSFNFIIYILLISVLLYYNIVFAPFIVYRLTWILVL